METKWLVDRLADARMETKWLVDRLADARDSRLMHTGDASDVDAAIAALDAFLARVTELEMALRAFIHATGRLPIREDFTPELMALAAKYQHLLNMKEQENSGEYNDEQTETHD